MNELNYFKNRIQKIKDTKKNAQERNVSSSWYYSIFYSIGVLLLLGAMLNMPIIIFVDVLISVASLQGTAVEQIAFDFLNVMIFVLPPFIVFNFMDKMIILHLIIFQNINKAMFYAWQKFDMWYFRKYRKHSPLTEIFSKFGDKSAKYNSRLTKNQKRMITIALIMVLIGVQVYWKLPMFEEMMIEMNEQNIKQMESDNQINERESNIVINTGRGG